MLEWGTSIQKSNQHVCVVYLLYVRLCPKFWEPRTEQKRTNNSALMESILIHPFFSSLQIWAERCIFSFLKYFMLKSTQFQFYLFSWRVWILKSQSSPEDISLMSRKRVFNLRFFELLICATECEAVNETTQAIRKVKTVLWVEKVEHLMCTSYFILSYIHIYISWHPSLAQIHIWDPLISQVQ